MSAEPGLWRTNWIMAYELDVLDISQIRTHTPVIVYLIIVPYVTTVSHVTIILNFKFLLYKT